MTAVCSGMSPTVTPLPRQNSRGPSSHRRRTVRRAVLELTSMIAARSLRGHSLSERSFSISDAATYLRGHLFVESRQLGTVDLDVRYDASYGSTMSVQAEVRPIEFVAEEATQVLIREARRRQRRRRLIILGALLILAITGWFTATAMSTDGSGPVARPLSPKSPDHPTVAAGRFSGTWHFHTTSVTIQSSGRGSATWPGPLGPGGSEATAVPGHADIRVTSVSGSQAIALISGSTVPSEVPDGPVQLRVTNQDLLYVVPVRRTTVSPFDPISFGPAGLCGPRATALAEAQQVAAGINCGA